MKNPFLDHQILNFDSKFVHRLFDKDGNLITEVIFAYKPGKGLTACIYNEQVYNLPLCQSRDDLADYVKVAQSELKQMQTLIDDGQDYLIRYKLFKRRHHTWPYQIEVDGQTVTKSVSIYDILTNLADPTLNAAFGLQ